MVAFCTILPLPSASQTFYLLDNFAPTTASGIQAHDVSPNGAYTAGSFDSSATSEREPYVWSTAGGFVELDPTNSLDGTLRATSVANDGTKAVLHQQSLSGEEHWWVWEQGVGLALLDPGFPASFEATAQIPWNISFYSSAIGAGITGDGSTIFAAWRYGADGTPQQIRHALFVGGSLVPTSIGDVPVPRHPTTALACTSSTISCWRTGGLSFSGDGSTIVGQNVVIGSGSSYRAAAWNSGGSLIYELPTPTYGQTVATTVSDNGQYAAGVSAVVGFDDPLVFEIGTGNPTNFAQPQRYTGPNQYAPCGMAGISDDASIVVGECVFYTVVGSPPTRGWIFDESFSTGISYQLPLWTTWHLGLSGEGINDYMVPRALSADGAVIAGNTQRTDGTPTAFVLDAPEPGFAVGLAIGGMLLAAYSPARRSDFGCVRSRL